MAEGYQESLGKYISDYVVDEFVNYASKNYTISKGGLYLVLARGNATSESVAPTIGIAFNNNEARNTGAVGGDVTTFLLAAVGPGDIIRVFTENVGTNSFYENYNRVTIIRLHYN